MQIVPRVQTSLTAKALAALVYAGFVAAGTMPTLALVEIIAAMIWVETAKTAGAFGFGWGNMSVAGFSGGVEHSTWTGKAWRPPWFDLATCRTPRDLTLHGQMLAGQAPSAFAAYDSAALGMAGLLSFLAHRIPDMIKTAARGDLAGFAASYHAHYAQGEQSAQAERAFDTARAELRAAAAFDGLVFAPPVIGPTPGPSFVAVAGLAVAAVGLWWAAKQTNGKAARA